MQDQGLRQRGAGAGRLPLVAWYRLVRPIRCDIGDLHAHRSVITSKMMQKQISRVVQLAVASVLLLSALW